MPTIISAFTEAEQQAVREILLRYCDPKLDGMTAWEIAGKILAAIAFEGGR